MAEETITLVGETADFSGLPALLDRELPEIAANERRLSGLEPGTGFTPWAQLRLPLIANPSGNTPSGSGLTGFFGRAMDCDAVILRKVLNHCALQRPRPAAVVVANLGRSHPSPREDLAQTRAEFSRRVPDIAVILAPPTTNGIDHHDPARQAKPSPALRPGRRRAKFPIFSSRRPGSLRMNNEIIAQLEAGEDIRLYGRGD